MSQTHFGISHQEKIKHVFQPRVVYISPFQAARETMKNSSQENSFHQNEEEISLTIEAQKNLDLKNLAQKLDQFPQLTDQAQAELRFVASHLWPYLTNENAIRFKSLQKINPEFKENNFNHSLQMIDLWHDINVYFPHIAQKTHQQLIIFETLIHDAGEFLHGDLEVKDQNKQTKKIKDQQETEAFSIIAADLNLPFSNSTLGKTIQRGFDNYQNRTSIEAYFVKALDQMSGNLSFHENITLYLQNRLDPPPTKNELIELLENDRINSPRTFQVYNQLMTEIINHNEQIFQLSSQELLEFFNFFRSAPRNNQFLK